MKAITEFSGYVIEIDYTRSTLLVRYEGAPPEIRANMIPVGLPVAYQHHYPGGEWRVNNGEKVNGVLPDQSRPLYAPLTQNDSHPAADALRWAGFGPEHNVPPKSDSAQAVALDIARWFVNGDRPDEFKLKEWAERLDRDAIDKAYADRASRP
jgi:hypothetical protein